MLDTGSDHFIFKLTKRFIGLKPIKPIAIKTADGNCHLTATHCGDAIIESFDDDGQAHKMTMPDALYCKDILVNLIPAIKLCNIGCRFEGNSTVIKFMNPGGDKIFARRQANTSQLWKIRLFNSSCLTVSTDIMYQRLGHLHSAAL